MKSESKALICFVPCLQHYTYGNSPSMIKALAGEVDVSFFSILNMAALSYLSKVTTKRIANNLESCLSQ